VFLKKIKGNKSVTFVVYRDQVLELIVFPLFDELGPEYIFIKNDAKIHLNHAKRIKFKHNVQGFQ